MALAVPSTDHAAGRIPKLPHFRKAYTKGIPFCARGRIPGPGGPGIRCARRGNVTCQKGTGLFWSVLSAETSRSSGDPPSSVIGKSAALSEVCGKFWTCRAHRGFAIINPQVERLSICGVVDPSRFCRILSKFRRISLKITVHITQNRPLPLLGSGLKPYE